MATILGWYKKRPGKEIRTVPVACPEGFRTEWREKGATERVVVVEARYDVSDVEDVITERLDIRLGLTEAIGLANQLLAAVEYARKP